MPDPRDQVELSSGVHPAPAAAPASPPGAGGAGQGGGGLTGRPWLSLWFRCSNTYVRAYRNGAGTGYMGRCPRCAKTIRFMVGPGGTSQRAFEVSC